MLRYALPLLALCASAAPLAAQDIAPAIDPIENARGLHMRNMYGAMAKQQGHRGNAQSDAAVKARQTRACADRPRFRAQYGADDPRFQKLEALCRANGYGAGG